MKYITIGISDKLGIELKTFCINKVKLQREVIKEAIVEYISAKNKE